MYSAVSSEISWTSGPICLTNDKPLLDNSIPCVMDDLGKRIDNIDTEYKRT